MKKKSHLYVGHFAFTRVHDTGEDWHGFFTLIVHAPSVDEALDQFHSFLIEFRKDKTFDVLRDIEKVYLDKCVEIPTERKSVLMTNFQQMHGQHPGEITAGPLGIHAGIVYTDGIDSYGWAPDGQTDEDREKGAIDEPFVIFNEEDEDEVVFQSEDEDEESPA